ncbi:MFS transporter [Streptosporangium sp. NPDC051022]|uniref:MFS transporter n=1 Tax=Streptosporangium sp. NPDC051022 TaxID=3155752 RepID=UPI0034417A37
MKDKYLVACLCCACMVVALQQTLVIPLLPDLPRLLDTSVAGASWLVTATLLTGAVSTPVLTRLADMVGKRRIALVCLAAVAGGGVMGALSVSLSSAVIARAVAGVGIPLIPISIAILEEELPDERSPARVALLSSTLAVGSAVGMVLPGIVAQVVHWRLIFLICGVAALVMIAGVVRVVPRREGRAPGRFDLVGAVILTVALVALLLLFTQAETWGWTSGPVISLAIGSVLATVLWIVLQLRVRDPLVDIRTLARPVLLLTNAGSLLVGFAMFMNLLATSQLLQLPDSTGAGLGMDAVRAGLWMTPIALSFGLLALLSSHITRRFGARTTLVAGALLMSAAYVGRISLGAGLWQIILASVAVSVGSAFAYAAFPVIVTRAVPSWQTSSANGLNNLLRSIGTTISSAVMAVLLTTTITRSGAGAAQQAFTYVFLIGALVAFVAFLVTLPLIWLPDFPPRTVESHTGLAGRP